MRRYKEKLEKELFEHGYSWASNYDYWEGYQEEGQDFWKDCNDCLYELAEKYVELTGVNISDATSIAQQGFDKYIQEYNKSLEEDELIEE